MHNSVSLALVGTSSVVDQRKSLVVVVEILVAFPSESSDTSFEVAAAEAAEAASGHDSALWTRFSRLCL